MFYTSNEWSKRKIELLIKSAVSARKVKILKLPTIDFIISIEIEYSSHTVSMIFTKKKDGVIGLQDVSCDGLNSIIFNDLIEIEKILKDYN